MFCTALHRGHFAARIPLGAFGRPGFLKHDDRNADDAEESAERERLSDASVLSLTNRAAITAQISPKTMTAPQFMTSPPTPDYVAQILPLGRSRCGRFKALKTRNIALSMRGVYGGARM
jgi:hypothetical protein